MKSTLLALGLAVTALSATALSGCAVVSDTPLFGEDQASPRPLTDGLWALSGPGCEVRPDPAGALPDCAIPMSIDHGQMRWDTASALARTLGPGARAMAAMPLPKSSGFRLVDGDPNIVEILNGASNQTPQPQSQPPAGAPPRQPLKPGYMALKVLHATPGGRIDRAVIWPILCPPDPTLPGFDASSGVGCRVQTIAALRERAAQLPPGLSYFMTWIRDEPTPAKSG
jgi:hypothetical protein